MSGDVQPRKRREKKKKKEDVTEETPFQHQQHATTTSNISEDVNIHIQKEASTGGGLCAKFVFFILLTLLTTLIGLIITEHRGLTDLDTIDKESRFTQLFDGWIENSINHDSPEQGSIEDSEEDLYEDDHDEDENEEQDEDEREPNETDEDDEDEDEDTVEETVEETAEETSELSNETEADEDDDDEDDADRDGEYNDDEEASLSKRRVKHKISTYEDEEEEQSLATKEDENDDDDDDDNDDDDDDDDDDDETDGDDDDNEISNEYDDKPDEDEETSENDDIKAGNDDETSHDNEENAEDEDDEENYEKIATAKHVRKSEQVVKRLADFTDSEEAAKLDNKRETDLEDEDDDEEKDEDEDEDDSTESARKVDQVPHKIAIDVENKNPPEEIDNSNMVVKFGVGTALLVVAHVVLIRKWRTGTEKADKKPQPKTEEKESVTPDLSRRNTLVPPPSLEEIEQDIENVEEEYSEDEEGYDSEEEKKPTRAKMRYQELQSTYSHSLSPNWEPKELREKLERNYEQEDDDEDNDEEEDDDDNPEEEDDYDEEISENEDAELMNRLETKYGKLQHSDEDVDGDNDDDDEGAEEDDDYEDDERDDRDEDFDSWKRVTIPSSKDGVIEDSDSENENKWSKQGSGPQALYEFENITNSDDWDIRGDLDHAHQNLANDAAYALILFNTILERYPFSPRASYGKARSLDILADNKKSNMLLQEAISSYQQILKLPNVPDYLFQLVAERCIDRMRFRGLYNQAINAHKLLIGRFPKMAKFSNDLAVTYLTTNRINEARTILAQTLLNWPNDGFALVHYGFILKTVDNQLQKSVEYLRKGIKTKESGVIDGRFYFHLGDALTRLGKTDEAMKIYLDGVKNEVFLSKYQRSLYNVNRLTGKPWWEKEDFPRVNFFQHLENNWKIIRDEGLRILHEDGYFKPESENLRDVGDWKQFELFARGIKNIPNCKQCPVTCKIVEMLPDAIGCRRGQIKFSVMHPGTHVWPHCGPTNCRLRIHLGLKVPPNTYIRVGEEIRTWEDGKVLVFDDSFEHEVWHNGTSTRLVLIIDVWHPELTKDEKLRLSSI